MKQNFRDIWKVFRYHYLFNKPRQKRYFKLGRIMERRGLQDVLVPLIEGRYIVRIFQ